MNAYVDSKGLLHIQPEDEIDELIMKDWGSSATVTGRTFRQDMCGFCAQISNSHLTDIVLRFGPVEK